MNTRGPKVYAVIPARGGSKGLPRKNLRPLGGIPLIAHSIKAAMQATLVNQVVVSTEDAEISHVAEEYGAQIVARPQALATDTAQNDAVVRHALECLRRYSGNEEDIVVLLQPTSPLRQAADIDACIARFRQGDVATVISVCEVDVHPGKCVKLQNGLITAFTSDFEMEARRQELSPVFRQNGAVYVVGVEHYLRHGRFYYRPCAGHLMDRGDSIDIDDVHDLQMAEVLLAAREGAAK